MNLSEAVSNIARKLGNRTDLDTAIAAEISLAQKELEAARSLPWFLLGEEQYLDIAADTDRVTLPTGFLREYEEGALWIEDASEGTFTKLTKVHFDELRRVVSTEEDDEAPAYYSLAGQYFHLAPPPATSTRLRIICYTAADALAEDEDTNAWLTYNPELLLAKAGMRMAQYLQNTGAYSMFQSQYVEAAMAQEKENVARKMENVEATMGGA